jgi:hypothetical protein
MLLKTYFALCCCAAVIFLGAISQKVFSQVPVNGSGKEIHLAYANEVPGSVGTIESVSRKSNLAPVKVLRSTPIPFGTPENLLLDMKGYDQSFVRTFTFQNTTKGDYTITGVDFTAHNSKFSFVSIEGAEASLPLDVKPGEIFTVKIAFLAADRNITYSDKMLIMTEQSNEPVAFPIQAMRQPLSSMTWNQRAQK